MIEPGSCSDNHARSLSLYQKKIVYLSSICNVQPREDVHDTERRPSSPVGYFVEGQRCSKISQLPQFDLASK